MKTDKITTFECRYCNKLFFIDQDQGFDQVKKIQKEICPVSWTIGKNFKHKLRYLH